MNEFKRVPGRCEGGGGPCWGEDGRKNVGGRGWREEGAYCCSVAWLAWPHQWGTKSLYLTRLEALALGDGAMWSGVYSLV